MSVTVALSSLSDCICGPLVERTARKYSRIIDTPAHFVEMLFLIEDKRFPIHFGIDPIAIARALIFNLQRGVRQGASTIAQQLYTIQLSPAERAPRSFAYKMRQVVWALGESAMNSKAALLKQYVETVYWGRSYHGLDRAAQGYFNGNRASLTVAQSFFLAERIGAPNRVSIARITNLLLRSPIKINLSRYGASFHDVENVYEQVYGRGGRQWQFLVKLRNR
jgi:membrane peptidoglycan carboxypeptidase